MSSQSSNYLYINHNSQSTNKSNSILEYSFLNKSKSQPPSFITQSQIESKNKMKANLTTDYPLHSNRARSSLKKTPSANRSHPAASNLSSSSLYEREIDKRKALNRKLGEERSLKRIDEEKELKPSPGMNEISRRLIEDRSSSPSDLYPRQNIIAERQRNNLKSLIQQENDNALIVKNKVFNKSDFERFIKVNDDFLKKKKNLREKRQIEIEEEINCQMNPIVGDSANRLNKPIKSRKNSKSSTQANSSHSPLGSPMTQLLFKKKIAQCDKERRASFTPLINNRCNSSSNRSSIAKPTLCSINRTQISTNGYSSYLKKNIKQKPAYTNPNSSSIESSSSIVHPYSSIKANHKLNQSSLKARHPSMRQQEIVIEQKESSASSGLYPLNIRSNLSSQDEHSILSLNKKHNDFIESYFF